MIISRTPLRISLAGGGTDLPNFYGGEEGAVISTTITTYLYVTVNARFDQHIRVSYSVTENVEDVEQVRHPLIREAMKLTGVIRGVEITTIADVPGTGTGLGSSSALTVGVLHALYAYRGEQVSPERLAREACHIELDILKEPIGKQDQYIAAYGGMNLLKFLPDERVRVEPLVLPPARQDALQDRCLLFFTGMTRPASSILQSYRDQVPMHRPILRQMKAQVGEWLSCLSDGAPLDRMGALLHQGWELKRRLASGVSNPRIDSLYERARAAGAIGGKIAGAGGGGFLLLYCPVERHADVRRVLAGLRELPFAFEPHGSRIIYASSRVVDCAHGRGSPTAGKNNGDW